MKKIKSIIALSAVLAMALATVVSAAPSPTAGIVTVVVPGSKGAKAAAIKTPTVAELTEIIYFTECRSNGNGPFRKVNA